MPRCISAVPPGLAEASPPHCPLPALTSVGSCDPGVKIRLLTCVAGSCRLLSSTAGSCPCSLHWLSMPLANGRWSETQQPGDQAELSASDARPGVATAQPPATRRADRSGNPRRERSHGVATGVSPAVSGRRRENAREPDATDARGCGESRRYR